MRLRKRTTMADYDNFVNRCYAKDPRNLSRKRSAQLWAAGEYAASIADGIRVNRGQPKRWI